MKGISMKVFPPTGSVIDLPAVPLAENVNFIKQCLAELVVTSGYTNYRLDYHNDDANPIPLNDFSELANYVQHESDETKMEIHMVPEDYDIRAAKLHVKRAREILATPPIHVVPDGNQNESENIEPIVTKDQVPVEKAEEEEQALAMPKISDADLPTEGEFFADIKLGNFFKETLFRVGTNNRTTTKSPSECISCIHYSGWNPPPPARKLQGDLFYIEIITENDGIIFITAVPKGFYVNRSTSTSFDPSPAATAHFSHELLHTLMSVSPSFAEAWTQATKRTVSSDTEAKALDSIATLLSEGKYDQVTVIPQWVVPSTSTSNSSGNEYKSKHTYDPSRAMDEMLDTFGLDEKGAPREWNDEIQTIRALTPKNMQESITQAKFMFKTISEFTEACRQTVIAIVDGHIPPVNAMDPEASYIYIYNNIFFSRAMDSKDSFRLVEGDEAVRKCNGQDMKNQKYLQQLQIEGLCTTLSSLVDYKGERIVCQGIIPGVLTVGEQSARLMMGVLEAGKRVRVKNSIKGLQDKLASALRLVKRALPAIPVPAPETETDTETVVPQSEPGTTSETEPQGEGNAVTTTTSSTENGNGIFGDMDVSGDQAILVDDEDEESPLDSLSVNHVGPLEGKFLRGNDNRIYALEMMRLTPRDANYVQGPKGTGNISEKLLSVVDNNIAKTYLIRRELIATYLQSEISKKRSELLEIELAKQIPTEGTPEEIANHKTAGMYKVTPELLQAINEMEPEKLVDLEINPNSFFNFDVDIDSSLITKDEESARKLANYLWNLVLPVITEKIRVGEIFPQGGQYLTEFLHSIGINMRYLGQLAKLAQIEEDEDEKLFAAAQKRKNVMPFYWLDMLMTEMVARAVKHIIGNILRTNKDIRSGPAGVISTILSHCLGTEDVLCGLCDTPPPVSSSHSKSNKKKKASKKTNGDVEITNKISVSTTIPSINNSDKIPTREEFWNQMRTLLTEKFGYDLDLVLIPKTVGGGIGLKDRISRVVLLRRICQLCGIRIVARDVAFEKVTPFHSDDIQGMVALVESSEPDPLTPESREFAEIIRVHLSEYRYSEAFEAAQEAASFTQQITGPVHKSAAMAAETLTAVLAQAGDFRAALATCSRNLAISVQLYGLDGKETMLNHLQMSNIYRNLDVSGSSIQHCLACMYIIGLTSGPRHPELLQIYILLANDLAGIENYALAWKCLEEGMRRCENGDQSLYASICGTGAKYLFRLSRFKEALQLQQRCFDLHRQLIGEEHETTLEAKKNYEILRRAVTERTVAEAKAKRAEEEAEKERQLCADWLDDMAITTDKHPKKTGKNKSKNGKRK